MQSITLQTNDTIVVSGDILGRLQFAASAESDGGAARLIGAGIYGMGEGSFSSSSNPASLVFITSDNDANAASAKLKISHEGHFLPISGSYNIGESGNRFNSIYGTGLAGYSLELASNVPSDTTNKLYNDGGTLKFNGSAVGGAGGGLDNVVEDTTPQLGGNLDLNSYSVTGVGNINIDGTIEANYIYSDLDGPIVIECKNSTGSTIPAGTPVYVSGYYGTNGKALIAPADAADSSKMPAIGLLEIALNDDSEGYVHCFGLSIGMSTASFSVGDTVYVASGEGITNTRPTASNVLVQNIGRVLRSDASQGRILVLGPGRTNDVPNSGNFDILSVTNSVTAGSLVKSGGTSSQFLKADGSTDSSTYLTSHPSISAASSSDNSGRTYIQDIGLDSFGHVTSIATATETVTDTDTNYYLDGITKSGNTLTFSVNGTSDQDYTFGSNAFTSYTDHSIQGYLTAHPTITAASSVDNSNGTVIQDITLDSNGHVTALGSIDLDSRYYTETEIDAFNYVDGNGTASYLPKWSDTDTLTNSVVYDDGTNIGIGQTSPSYKLEVNGNIGLTSDGFYASPTGVMIGTNGWLYNDGQIAVSHGSFSSNGDAQNSVYMLRGSTTNATFTTIQNNGSDVILASNRTMIFTANIVGRRTNGSDNASYKLEGMLYNDGYGASIIGTPVKTTIGETDSSWDVQATISGAGAGGSDYLNIQVKGASFKNINWVAKLEILEVGGDISSYTEANILDIDPDIIP
jgi:hypothetical protein